MIHKCDHNDPTTHQLDLVCRDHLRSLTSNNKKMLEFIKYTSTIEWKNEYFIRSKAKDLLKKMGEE